MAAIDAAPDWGADYQIKNFVENGKQSWALFSGCGSYRYRLRRHWAEGERLAFLMLNPSTADEVKNDPTVERCERRARLQGFGGFEVVNIFALRSTDPRGLYSAQDPIGAQNDRAITEAIETTHRLLCAWGGHGKLMERGQKIRGLLGGADCFHLGLTKAGEPKHPLYISYDTQPTRWSV